MTPVRNQGNCGSCLWQVLRILGLDGYGKTDEFGDEIDYWMVLNSWAEGWGEYGHIKIALSKNGRTGNKTISLSANFPIFSVDDVIEYEDDEEITTDKIERNRKKNLIIMMMIMKNV